MMLMRYLNTRIQVLLLRANSLGFRAKNLRKTLPMTRKGVVERGGMCSTIRAGGNSRGTGCDLVHILDPKINDSLEMMVQINSNNEVGSCPPYSTSSTANTAVPASPKCGNNF
ncbi:hypothetical protein [Bradyrhizobium sp. URHC0002]